MTLLSHELFRRVAREESGAAAIEFAFVMPVLLLLCLGGFDSMQMVRAADKVETATKTAADLTAQESTSQAVPFSDIQTIIGATQVAATPFNDATMTVTVSAIDLKLNSSNTCCDATVNWSVTQGGTLRPCSVTLKQNQPSDAWAPNTIPASIATQATVTINKVQTYATSIIVTDVSYTYNGLSPAFSKIVNQTITRHAYAIPRLFGQVTLSSVSNPSAGQSGKVC